MQSAHNCSSFNGRLVRVHFLLYINKLNRGQKRGRDVEADKRSWRDTAKEENILFKCREETGQQLFQFLCRPLSSNRFMWLKMLMKFDETELNTE